MASVKINYDWAVDDLEQIADAASTLNSTFNRFAKKVRKLKARISDVRDELGESGAIVGTQKAAFTRAMKRVDQIANDIEAINFVGMSDVVLDLVRTFNPEYVPETNDQKAVEELDNNGSETLVDAIVDVVDVVDVVSVNGGIASFSKSILDKRRDAYRRSANKAFGYPVYRSIRRRR